jgi:hypothetical protein
MEKVTLPIVADPYSIGTIWQAAEQGQLEEWQDSDERTLH